jgi:hypothetical protein
MSQKTRRGVQRRIFSLALVLLAVPPLLGSCHRGNEGKPPKGGVGVASLRLQATAASGATYRLVGQFVIAGTADLTLSTDDYPGQSMIDQTLAVGDYTVTLADGWQLLRKTSSGDVPSTNAVLLSPQVQSLTIVSGQVSLVTFSFIVDGYTVSTSGTLTISIEVTERIPDAGTPDASSPPAGFPSPVVYYSFDDDFMSTGVIKDQSGNGHNAVLGNGTFSRPAGINGTALGCDGSGYARAADNPTAHWSQFTLSLWFKTDCPVDCDYYMASAAAWPPGSGWYLATWNPQVWTEGDDICAGGTLIGPEASARWNTQFTAGAWNHVAMTYDGSTRVEYVNGQYFGSWTGCGGLPLGAGWNLMLCWWIGIGSFVGSLDEFRAYNVSLTEAEVQALYAAH